jgi:hypothetical protein
MRCGNKGDRPDMASSEQYNASLDFVWRATWLYTTEGGFYPWSALQTSPKTEVRDVRRRLKSVRHAHGQRYGLAQGVGDEAAALSDGYQLLE